MHSCVTGMFATILKISNHVVFLLLISFFVCVCVFLLSHYIYPSVTAKIFRRKFVYVQYSIYFISSALKENLMLEP